MNLYLTELKSNKGNFVPYHFEKELAELVGTDQGDGNISMDLKAAYFSGKVLIKGTMAADVMVKCSRCLLPFTYNMSVTFNEEFIQVGEEEINQRNENYLTEAEKTAACFCFHGDVLDLSDFFRQLFLVSLPLKPLCRQDCRGLCPQCGVNLNYSRCDCQREEIDPRWAVLKGLIEK